MCYDPFKYKTRVQFSFARGRAVIVEKKFGVVSVNSFSDAANSD